MIHSSCHYSSNFDYYSSNSDLYNIIMKMYDPVDIQEAYMAIRELSSLFKDLQFAKNISTQHNISFPLTKWYKITKDRFVSIKVYVNLDNYSNYSLRVVEGRIWEGTYIIFDTDKSIGIRTDRKSVLNATKDILNNIPIHDLDKSEYNNYTYIIDD